MAGEEILKTTPEVGKIEVSEAEEKDIAKKYEEEGIDLGAKAFIYQGLVEKNRSKLNNQEKERDIMDAKVKALDQSQEKLKEFMEKHSTENIVDKIGDITKQKDKILKNKGNLEDRITKRTEKLEKAVDKRNKVLDKLYGKYEKKVVPLQEKFEDVKKEKHEIDLELAVKKIKHREALADIKVLEKDKQDIVKSLHEAGISYKDIYKIEGIKAIEKEIAEVKDKIAEEKKQDQKREQAIKKEFDKREKKVSRYTNRQKEIVCIKEGRIYIEPPQPKVKAEAGTVAGTVGGVETVAHTASEQESGLTLESLLRGWNAQLKRAYKKEAVTIKPREFLDKVNLNINSRLSSVEFGFILDKYYTLKKLPQDQYRSNINPFVKRLENK